MITMTIRAFLALPLSLEQVRDLSVLAGRLKQNVEYSNLNWIKAHNFHLTMRFLGNIQQRDIEELDQQLIYHLEKSASFAYFELDQIVPAE